MPSRREFLRAGLAFSVIPVAAPVRAASGAPTAPIPTLVHYPLYCVVCDLRSPSSVAMAREASRAGRAVVGMRGDITDFWFHDLALRWRETPVPVGGLTGTGPLFCLERLGWDHGMRVVFRGAHRFLDPRHLEHAISGPPGTIAAARGAGLDGPDWPLGVARLLGACEAVRGNASMTVMGAAPPGGRVDEPETLVSWVIAPKRAYE